MNGAGAMDVDGGRQVYLPRSHGDVDDDGREKRTGKASSPSLRTCFSVADR